MKPIQVGLLGIGTVGSGTYRVITRNRALIRARAGRDITLHMLAARNLPRARAIVGAEVEVVADTAQVARHPQIDVVVEAIGGCTVAREAVLDAIAHGKHVVTANKALLALHGEEIFEAARQQGVMVAFEGAVAVSIPIVKALREGMAGNRIEWLAGIVNGTSNFVLSEMRDKGMSFACALREAQRQGYAEADPAFDVQGTDAGHKLALLAAMAFGTPVRFDQMHIEGIDALQPSDHAMAESLGYRIKLLAIARCQPDGLELRVHPTLVAERSMLAGVNGSMNGVMVHSDAAGATMYCGAGAGAEQTASAVIADLVDVARLADVAPAHRVAPLGFRPEALSPLRILPIGEARTRQALRVPVHASHAALAEVLQHLAARNITIDVHRELADAEGGRELVLLTREAREADLQQALAVVSALACVRGPIRSLRVEAFQ
jgi:homoserine dehydrogenase